MLSLEFEFSVLSLEEMRFAVQASVRSSFLQERSHLGLVLFCYAVYIVYTSVYMYSGCHARPLVLSVTLSTNLSKAGTATATNVRRIHTYPQRRLTAKSLHLTPDRSLAEALLRTIIRDPRDSAYSGARLQRGQITLNGKYSSAALVRKANISTK